MTGMARPEVDDDLIEKLEKIVDESTQVPLPPEELSVNQQLRILIEAAERSMREDDDSNYHPIDAHYN